MHLEQVHVAVPVRLQNDRHAFGVRFDLPGLGRFVPSQLRLDIEVTAVRAPRIPEPR